jgi:hypothetical protein
MITAGNLDSTTEPSASSAFIQIAMLREHLPNGTYEYLSSYFTSLKNLEVSQEVLRLIAKAILLFVKHNLDLGKPHLINELFHPSIDPSKVVTPESQDPFLEEIDAPLTRLYAMLRDFRNDEWKKEILERIEDKSAKGEGTFTILSGGMFSGKSNLLVQLIQALQSKDPGSVLAFVPSAIGEAVIIAREPRQEIPAAGVTLEGFIDSPRLKGDIQGKTVVLDEVVFLAMPKNKPKSPEEIESYNDLYHERCQILLDFLVSLRARGAHVIVAGIKSDITSTDFLFYQYLKSITSEEVRDEHTMITQLDTNKDRDFEDVLSMEPAPRVKAMKKVRKAKTNRVSTPRYSDGSPSVVEYSCAASYSYWTADGKLVIAPATETARTAYHLAVSPDGTDAGIVDMLWMIFLPSRADGVAKPNLPKAQQLGAQLVRYFSRPEHCSIWYFLKTQHRELFEAIRHHIQVGTNLNPFNNLLEKLETETGEN